jgi:hypothetical protein
MNQVAMLTGDARRHKTLKSWHLPIAVVGQGKLVAMVGDGE